MVIPIFETRQGGNGGGGGERGREGGGGRETPKFGMHLGARSS